MKYIKLILILLMPVVFQSVSAQSFFVSLYPEGQIPNYRNSGEKEVRDTTDIVRISKVQNPDIQVFLPAGKSRTGNAIVICPGGGYHILAYDWEGEDIAKYWNSKGVTAIVLKYRLPTSESQIIPYKSPLMDAQRAIRLVRYHSEEWGINPERVGIMGFSAGGHLASTLSTHFDEGNQASSDPVEKFSCRPDFSMLIYPVISFTADFAHTGSEKALLGKEPDPELARDFSNELRVGPDTPPAILVHAADDKGVPVNNSIVYFQALRSNSVEASLLIYPYGGHGFGLATGKGYLSGWPDQCNAWLKYIFSEEKK